MITTFTLATSHLFLSFDISCYKLSCAHAHISIFFSFFLLSICLWPHHTSCYFFEWMNECVFLSVKGLGGEQSTWNVVVLPSFLGPPLLRRAKCCCGWPSVCRCTNGMLSLSALLLVQLFNYKIASYTRFLHLWVKRCVYFNLLQKAFGVNLTIYFSVLFRNIFCLRDVICSFLIWKTH